MSYFDDQEDAWFANGCEGTIEGTNPDEVYMAKFTACEAKGHGEIKKGVCQSCNFVVAGGGK